LETLICSYTQVSDLGPLRAMTLTFLDCSATQVRDLSPLKGLPLANLNCGHTGVSDLTPLRGMPLENLGVNVTRVTDLTSLEGMKLQVFLFTPRHITKGIELLRHMGSIRKIGDSGSSVMAPEDFWRKYEAGEFR